MFQTCLAATCRRQKTEHRYPAPQTGSDARCAPVGCLSADGVSLGRHTHTNRDEKNNMLGYL